MVISYAELIAANREALGQAGDVPALYAAGYVKALAGLVKITDELEALGVVNGQVADTIWMLVVSGIEQGGESFGFDTEQILDDEPEDPEDAEVDYPFTD